jgi:predicted nucleotidyltransferase
MTLRRNQVLKKSHHCLFAYVPVTEKPAALLNKYMLKKIGVFGSFARGEPANDIVFYIDTDSCKLADLRRLKIDLEALTNVQILFIRRLLR